MSNEDGHDTQTTADSSPAMSMNATASAKPRRWQPYLILLAVFVAGAAVGGSVTRAQMQQGWQASLKQQRGPRGPIRLAAMTRKLDLSAEQRERIKTILDAADAQRESAIAPCKEQLHETRSNIDKQIRDVLTAEQLPRFEKMTKRLRDKHRRKGRKHRRHRRPPEP